MSMRKWLDTLEDELASLRTGIREGHMEKVHSHLSSIYFALTSPGEPFEASGKDSESIVSRIYTIVALRVRPGCSHETSRLADVVCRRIADMVIHNGLLK